MHENIPALFIGHGSPMNMIQENSYTNDLNKVGKVLQKPKAIVVISAHWLTIDSFITADKNPKMIYDYYGFPEALYEIKYDAPGSPEIAEIISEFLPLGKYSLSLKWGFDHACYAVLKYLFPNADIPVIELSLDYHKSPKYHYELGQKLAPLREKGIMFIGSGNMIHTFKHIKYQWDGDPFPWVKDYDEILRKAITSGDHKNLINYKNWPLSEKAFQTNEHYLPMLYILAMQGKEEELKFIHHSIQHGSVSHRCFQVG